jgi:F-type H+-transporting ATPase subunit b
MSLLAFLAETAAHGGEHGEAVKDPFPAFDPTWFASQLFWLAVFFLGLYFALSRFILPKLSDTLEKRANRIAADLDEAARLNNQSVEAQKALELRLAQARAKARETADKAREKTEAELATETARVDADLTRKLETAESRISKLRADAMKNVEQIAIDTAEAMTARLGVKASKADVKKAVTAALEKRA